MYKQRFGFIDVERTLENYMNVLQYWNKNELDPEDLDHFSYDFEKFVGDVRESELWKPEIQRFRNKHSNKIAVCVGEYHTTFIQSVLDGKEQKTPNWNTHIDMRREDKLTPQDATFLKQIYAHLNNALNL